MVLRTLAWGYGALPTEHLGCVPQVVDWGTGFHFIPFESAFEFEEAKKKWGGVIPRKF